MLTAKEWGWSPTAVIREAKDPKKPHPLDYAVATAVKIIEDSRCPKCGVLAWHAYSTDNMIEFECEDIHCQACAEKERVESESKHTEPGVTKVVKAKPALEDEPLPSRRDFFERMAAERERDEARRRAKLTGQ